MWSTLIKIVQFGIKFPGERLNSEQAEEIIDHAGKADEEGMVKYEDFISRVLAGPFPEEETD